MTTSSSHRNDTERHEADVTYLLTLGVRDYWDIVDALRAKMFQDERNAQDFNDADLKASFAEDAARCGRLLARVRALRPEPEPDASQTAAAAAAPAPAQRPRHSEGLAR